jgi:membrane protein YdbS with pleckstrin-like domain
MAKCINCGAYVSESDKFCRNCGEKIVSEIPGHISEVETAFHEDSGIIPREILTEGEKISFEIRPVLWLWLVAPILGALLGIIISIAAQFLPESVPTVIITSITWLSIVILIIALIFILSAILRWRYTAYASTNRRIIRQTGIVGKSYIDCPLNKVQTVYLQIPVLGRIFDFGTIRFATAGAAWVEIDWENVRQPRKIQRILSEIMDDSRHEVSQP